MHSVDFLCICGCVGFNCFLSNFAYISEQQPLRLNAEEICEVIAAVCTETPSTNSNLTTISSKLSNNGRPSLDVAVSVLVKLIIDMYVLMHFVYTIRLH